MNIVISTDDTVLFCQLYRASDAAISARRLHSMELYAFRSLAPEEILGEVSKAPGELWLVYLDGDSLPCWADALDRLTGASSRIMVCMVSRDYKTAAQLINSRSVRGIAGYIHPDNDDISRTCLNLLTYLNRRVSAMNDFLVVHSRRQEVRIPFSSICYIETEKGTHMCSIYCHDGIYTLRSSIKELLNRLDHTFCLVRASTIANLSHVRAFDPALGLLTFSPDMTCCCSRRRRQYLTDYFRRHSLCRSTGKDTGEDAVEALRS